MFSMSGSLIPAAHTLAHAKTADIIEVDGVDAQHHEHDATKDGHHDSDAKDHHKHTDHADHADHGAELHFTAIGIAQAHTDLLRAEGSANLLYRDIQYPAPALPPDPDPDRI